MKCHQKVVKERAAARNAGADMWGNWWEDLDLNIDGAELREVSIRTASAIIKEYEYLGTMCNAPIRAYGIFWQGNCGGVVVFGAVSPPNVARSVCSSHPKKVIQLGRGASVHWAHPHSSSKLIAYGLSEIAKLGYWFAIAYSDPDAGEIGTVYQASNWNYCGLTAKRPDYITPDGKRLVGNVPAGFVSKCKIVERTRKHRYVAMLGSKDKVRAKSRFLDWKIVEKYPKRDRDQERSADDQSEGVGQCHGLAPLNYYLTR